MPALDAADIYERLNSLLPRAQALEAEGLPFPSHQVAESVREAIAQGDLARATDMLKRGEALYARVSRDWVWVRELLRRADELRAIGTTLGVDVGHLDARVGNARQQLGDAPLSVGTLERAAASASLAVAVLTDAIPKYCVQEAQRLGAPIRTARNRGEDVGEATVTFGRLLHALPEAQIPVMSQCLLDVRRSVARIPRAPAVATIPADEAEEILLEARNLARRLHKIKSRARDAQGAARLMAEVRAALSEDRRFGSPEEEVEELWNEVDRLSRERQDVSPPYASPVVADDSAAPEMTQVPEASRRARSGRSGR